LRERHLLVIGQILLAQADPAAARRERRADDLSERPARLPTVGDQQQGRRRQPHVPTRPSCGLDGSAKASLGMRPASRAWRPASTAARIAFAIVAGSRAFDTAVLSNTAAQPSSIASAASEAVPMPA